jgi:Lon protease-like protein
MAFSLIPLFPLPMVLFPGQVRQLRIFEPRYRAMLQDCLTYQMPFGLVLARPPRPDGEESLPHEIGTTAYITDVERLQDGTFGISIQGSERFRITTFKHDKPYLQGIVEPMPMVETDDARVGPLHRRLSELLPTYLEALTQASGFRYQVQVLPDEPEHLGYLTAIVLQTNNETKQELLSIRQLPRFLARSIRLVRSELDLMEWIIRTIEQTHATGFGTGGWMNLN